MGKSRLACHRRRPISASRCGVPTGAEPRVAAHPSAAKENHHEDLPSSPSGRRRGRVAPVDVTATTNVNYTNLPKVVYFDFDSYVVKDEFRPVIEANAKALTTNRKMHMAVEGHTDDRGSSEYNLALGQRRAEAVKKVMTVLGAGDSRIETVSYGEEKPVAQGHDEDAWAKNRRDDFRYVSR